MAEDKDALKTVNDFGFPLQIAVGHQVKATTARHGWTIRYTEHSWVNRLDGQSGFIDLVLQDSHSSTLVVECKRTKATWLFMNADGVSKPRRHAKAWVSGHANGAMRVFGWHDMPIDPMCSEALFCIIKGQTSGERRPMLERIGGELTSATEALAREEKDFHMQQMLPRFRFYFNVVVTTAELKVAQFKPEDISLVDGTLADADFQPVPYLRFRKQMSLRETLLTSEDFKNSVDPADTKESTLFVVRADAVLDFLKAFELPPVSLNDFPSV